MEHFVKDFTKTVDFSQYSPPFSLAAPPFEFLCTPLFMVNAVVVAGNNMRLGGRDAEWSEGRGWVRR